MIPVYRFSFFSNVLKNSLRKFSVVFSLGKVSKVSFNQIIFKSFDSQKIFQKILILFRFFRFFFLNFASSEFFFKTSFLWELFKKILILLEILQKFGFFRKFFKKCFFSLKNIAKIFLLCSSFGNLKKQKILLFLNKMFFENL